MSIGNLQSLIDGGHIESESKLGICPGAGAKPKLPHSSYAGGPDLDGTKKLSSEGINSETIILADANTSHHKAGKNAIRLDGSFVQGEGIGEKIRPVGWWTTLEELDEFIEILIRDPDGQDNHHGAEWDGSKWTFVDAFSPAKEIDPYDPAEEGSVPLSLPHVFTSGSGRLFYFDMDTGMMVEIP